jgi:hypothetical protein
MSDTNEDKQWAGLHVTPGREDDQSAFRSEIGGLEVTAKRLCTTFLINTKLPQQQMLTQEHSAVEL